MLSAQELNVIGLVNCSVETNVLVLAKLVIVANTSMILTEPGVITVARNPTPPVKSGMETLHVKDKYCSLMSLVMDLVDKLQDMDTPCYPAMTKMNVILEFLHAEEHLNAQSK